MNEKVLSNLSQKNIYILRSKIQIKWIALNLMEFKPKKFKLMKDHGSKENLVIKKLAS
jgi:hypothetical protein